MYKNGRNKSIIIKNLISIIVIIIFIITEIFYLNVFNIKIDIISLFNINNKTINNEIDYHYIATKSTTSDEKINKKPVQTRVFDGSFGIDKVGDDYFADALFIGDSRLQGLALYKKFDGAVYYCYQSASCFTILEQEYDTENYGSISLYDLITSHSFGKIYISLGTNNLGSPIALHKEVYKKMLDTIIVHQPNAIIYLLANLHVIDSDSTDMPYINNANIDEVNLFISQFSDGLRIFYLDPNVLYDDENGGLNPRYSTDRIHIYINMYDKYLRFLKTRGVIYYD